jgi:hypothetical protein
MPQAQAEVKSYSQVIAVMGSQLVSKRVKTSANSLPTKIGGRLREANDARQRGLGELWIGKAFYILFLWLRAGTLLRIQSSQAGAGSSRVRRYPFASSFWRTASGDELSVNGPD